ncbi:hypothetical protein [Halogeometricum borinquense]|uniref:hypothetical protein n=1 Tax=Halogeometricum borinquense TaxID=60847 RepID=UPI00342F41B0
MSRGTRAAGILGTGLGGVVTYTLYADPLLSATAGLCWGVGSALTVRYRTEWTGDPDRTSAADGLPSAFVLFVGLFGVHAGLPIPDGLRWALVVLVVGALLAAIGLGILLARRATTA